MQSISSPTSSSDDNTLLLDAQQGKEQSRNHIPTQFTGLIRTMVRRACGQHHGVRVPHDFVDDAVNETYRMVFDPKVARYNINKADAKAYLFGLVLNAVRIITGQRQSLCLDGTSDDVIDQRKAAVIYANTTGLRIIPMVYEQIENQDQLAFVLDGQHGRGEQMAKAYYVDGEPMAHIAARYGISRFTVSREMEAFCVDAGRRLASGHAA